MSWELHTCTLLLLLLLYVHVSLFCANVANSQILHVLNYSWVMSYFKIKPTSSIFFF